VTETLPVDAGLIERFRVAGAKIAWRSTAPSVEARPKRQGRIAHLNDEETRVETWGRLPGGGMEVDSGPLGALVLLLEADRRRALPNVESREAGADPGFPQGALRASWSNPSSRPEGPTVRDLVELARYALA
jgi:hypothetical protein